MRLMTFGSLFATRGQDCVVAMCLNGKNGKRYDAESETLIPYQGVRRLMPLECERLQGFPDGWTEGFSDAARYRMLGNAVSVPVAEWIGRRILACE